MIDTFLFESAVKRLTRVYERLAPDPLKAVVKSTNGSNVNMLFKLDITLENGLKLDSTSSGDESFLFFCFLCTTLVLVFGWTDDLTRLGAGRVDDTGADDSQSRLYSHSVRQTGQLIRKFLRFILRLRP